MNIEMKKYFDGKDIETLPREKLLEVIDCLFNELESTRQTTKSILELNKLYREVRSREREGFWSDKKATADFNRQQRELLEKEREEKSKQFWEKKIV
jgi:hypothetical protein